MKKYIIPTIEVITLETEATVMTQSGLSVNTGVEVESGAAPGRRRGDAWSEYEGE